jgi:ABC-2 type transport system permease protein
MNPLELAKIIFGGPGKLMQTLMGGESINYMNFLDMLTVGYVHPTVVTILCIWAVGRAAGSVAGEIDRGTMELLLAQPIPRSRVILAHLWVDVLTIPLVCLGLWSGNWLGVYIFGHIDLAQSSGAGALSIDPRVFAPALVAVAGLVFAVSGLTMFLSSRGRSRNRVLAGAVLLVLVQFIINALGQLWDGLERLRPFTVFYYYPPQQIILLDHWTVATRLPGQEMAHPVNGVLVLFVVGAVGYALALWTFCRRDLPAPL